VIADIPGQMQAHGIAIVPRLNRGFITDGGGAGSILIFDLKTYQVIGKLAALPDVDAMIYDAGIDRVLVASGDGNALITVNPDVDPKSGKIDLPIKLGGGPESLTSDGNGKVYINLEDKNVVAVVDLKARKVMAQWPVLPGGHPVGIAMDTSTHQLFIGCRNPQKLIVMNAENGKIEASLPIGAGIDGTEFSNGHVFVSCGDGTLAIASNKSGKFEISQIVRTRKGSRTLTVDGASRRVYLPAAVFDPVTKGWPKVKSGTFAILVLQSL
jgi:outer membrane protein assembly factor BamB